jgi:hypothetical protein
MIDLFAKVNAVTLPVYLDLHAIGWREREHFLGNIRYPHQLGAISFPRSPSGGLLGRQRSRLLDKQMDWFPNSTISID